MKQETQPLTVRFPPALLKQLRICAIINNRSLNGEILTAIEEHVKREAKKKGQ
ncbi:Arc family DNA-binding protein [Ktedonobacter sp. SOSP1-52]|uniref:Arc family DNA-binding protein n=1 Tax=Ktedonobacter sp. SOSP1-52 TaxID=2778366 RepID=UPI0019161CC8